MHLSLISLWASQLLVQAGERVRVTARVNEEWVEGETEDGGQRGMFPVSFVDRVAPDLPNKTSADTEPAQTAQVCATPVYYYITNSNHAIHYMCVCVRVCAPCNTLYHVCGIS